MVIKATEAGAPCANIINENGRPEQLITGLPDWGCLDITGYCISYCMRLPDWGG